MLPQHAPSPRRILDQHCDFNGVHGCGDSLEGPGTLPRRNLVSIAGVTDGTGFKAFLMSICLYLAGKSVKARMPWRKKYRENLSGVYPLFQAPGG
jgi:hypothetical protein